MAKIPKVNFKGLFFALLAGVVFGVGLLISGLSNPAKVIAFLDVFGAWDPSLALVMAGAIAVGLLTFAIAKRRKTSLTGEAFNLPENKVIDARLVLGSLIFGIAWGLAGICPGPGLVLLGQGNLNGFIFVSALVSGFVIYEIIQINIQKK
jgi:uncharacterized membrane protein YedE/YeeE